MKMIRWTPLWPPFMERLCSREGRREEVSNREDEDDPLDAFMASIHGEAVQQGGKEGGGEHQRDSQ